MARKPGSRSGAFYQIIVRGNRHQKISRDDKDRLSYLERLDHYRQHNYSVYAYVLMFNYVHLLVKTQRIALFNIMQEIQFS